MFTLMVLATNMSVIFIITNVVTQIHQNIRNLLNLRYVADVFAGSAKVKSEVVYDTGSGWLTLATSDCLTCHGQKYNTSESTYAKFDKNNTKNLTVFYVFHYIVWLSFFIWIQEF